jgi:hypothetical protein|nr:MAG TPA: hypothetical protein [Caudoviricetes sp.]
MEKYFVTKEEAIALAEIGCKFDTPFYYDRTNDVMFDVEVYMGYDDAGHNEIVNCDFDDLQFERSSDKEILAPTIHEALEWFESKGERYMIKVEFNDYTAEVMQEGTFIPIGKYKSRKEAEESIMKFYIRTGIEEKIYKLEKLTKI